MEKLYEEEFVPGPYSVTNVPVLTSTVGYLYYVITYQHNDQINIVNTNDVVTYYQDYKAEMEALENEEFEETEEEESDEVDPNLGETLNEEYQEHLSSYIAGSVEAQQTLTYFESAEKLWPKTDYTIYVAFVDISGRSSSNVAQGFFTTTRYPAAVAVGLKVKGE